MLQPIHERATRIVHLHVDRACGQCARLLPATADFCGMCGQRRRPRVLIARLSPELASSDPVFVRAARGTVPALESSAPPSNRLAHLLFLASGAVIGLAAALAFA
jgi:hypothetical protein